LYKTETRPHFLAVVVVNENFIANCLSVENSYKQHKPKLHGQHDI